MRSMTGHGQAMAEVNGYRVSAEIKTVNNRYFKANIRGLDGFGSLEPKVESMLRSVVHRGTVNLSMRLVLPSAAASHEINSFALGEYASHLRSLSEQHKLIGDVSLDCLLALPGVLVESTGAAAEGQASAWPAVESALTQALGKLQAMREAEGQAMLDDFSANCDCIQREVTHVEARCPEVIMAYQSRLTEKINQLLADHDCSVEPADVVREVGIFADRCDVSEEIVRLKSHVKQFRSVLQANDCSGKKLDFLIQEMFREANTIGSKANDATMSAHVVEIKTYIERMREMVQNVE